MKNIIPITLCSILSICLLGCTIFPPIKIAKDDRNGDGKIDSIFFTYRDWLDTDYGFQDRDFDGRFEVKISYGEGGYEEEKLSPQLTLEEIEKTHPSNNES
jgi:hypothetical protein